MTLTINYMTYYLQWTPQKHTCEEEECFKFLLLRQIDFRMILLIVIHVNM